MSTKLIAKKPWNFQCRQIKFSFKVLFKVDETHDPLVKYIRAKGFPTSLSSLK